MKQKLVVGENQNRIQTCLFGYIIYYNSQNVTISLHVKYYTNMFILICFFNLKRAETKTKTKTKLKFCSWMQISMSWMQNANKKSIQMHMQLNTKN